MIGWPGIGIVNQECIKPEGQVTPLLSDTEQVKVADAYDEIALAIAAFEASSESNAYTSKLDAARAGQATFSALEARGRDIFRTVQPTEDTPAGKCVLCHVGSRPDEPPPLFTYFTFDNLGVPRNPLNPASIADPNPSLTRR